MKTSKSMKAIIMAVTIICLIGTMFGFTSKLSGKSEYVSENKTVLKNSNLSMPSVMLNSGNIADGVDENIEIKNLDIASAISEEEIKTLELEEMKSKIVYDGMTLDQLAAKLDRSLNSTIAGQGYTFASYAVEMGIDPYLAVAIVLHETGCKWQCSSLLRECNNVGGMKAGGNGYCGSYARFDSLEDGIKSFMNNLNRNYFSQGLTTPEAIGPKYAASGTWATQVNAYMNSIKAA